MRVIRAATQRSRLWRRSQDNVAVYSPDAGVLNATKSCAMFQRLAAQRGAHLRDRTVRPPARPPHA